MVQEKYFIIIYLFQTLVEILSSYCIQQSCHLAIIFTVVCHSATQANKKLITAVCNIIFNEKDQLIKILMPTSTGRLKQVGNVSSVIVK